MAGTTVTANRAAAPTGLAALCERAEVSEDGRALLASGAISAAPDFVRALVDAGLFPDAVRVVAHSLPKREAVWWVWVCARRSAGDEPPPAIAASLAATERWIAQPDDASRRAAMEAAEAADLGTPAGCAGLAAFFSGGSIAPPDAPPTPPLDRMTAKAVAGGVILAAVSKEPEKAAERFSAFVQQGVDVALRVGAWGAVPAPPATPAT